METEFADTEEAMRGWEIEDQEEEEDYSGMMDYLKRWANGEEDRQKTRKTKGILRRNQIDPDAEI